MKISSYIDREEDASGQAGATGLACIGVRARLSGGRSVTAAGRPRHSHVADCAASFLVSRTMVDLTGVE